MPRGCSLEQRIERLEERTERLMKMAMYALRKKGEKKDVDVKVIKTILEGGDK